MGHHFVPRRYLRNFEDSSRLGFIWIHDRRGGPPRQAAIARVAQSKGFYNPETEVVLANEVEAPANAVIRKLVQEVVISEDERLQMTAYIGVMLRRIPASRRRGMEMIPGALASVTSQLREQLRLLARSQKADPATLERRLREVDAAERKFGNQPPSEVLDQIREPWPSEGMLEAVFRMTWRVLVSSGPTYFVTTDNPAFFFRGLGLGLGNAESELSFPLSTTHALHGSWTRMRTDLTYVRAPQSLVREINRRLVSEAERLAFYHKAAPWLSDLLAKKRPFLSVIRW